MSTEPFLLALPTYAETGLSSPAERGGPRPIHISELCSHLKVSRRSLHRAFSEALGIGPMAFLRRSRLTSIHSILKRADPATVKVGDVATEYGFTELGRFAFHYKRLFGEHPHKTLAE
jgi:AraC family ethanolamine operon transcriptional activator